MPFCDAIPCPAKEIPQKHRLEDQSVRRLRAIKGGIFERVRKQTVAQYPPKRSARHATLGRLALDERVETLDDFINFLPAALAHGRKRDRNHPSARVFAQLVQEFTVALNEKFFAGPFGKVHVFDVAHGDFLVVDAPCVVRPHQKNHVRGLARNNLLGSLKHIPGQLAVDPRIENRVPRRLQATRQGMDIVEASVAVGEAVAKTDHHFLAIRGERGVKIIQPLHVLMADQRLNP